MGSCKTDDGTPGLVEGIDGGAGVTTPVGPQGPIVVSRSGTPQVERRISWSGTRKGVNTWRVTPRIITQLSTPTPTK